MNVTLDLSRVIQFISKSTFTPINKLANRFHDCIRGTYLISYLRIFIKLKLFCLSIFIDYVLILRATKVHTQDRKFQNNLEEET